MAAAASFDISLFGDRKLTKALAGMEFKLQKKWLNKGMRAGFKLTHKAARQVAQSHRDTGALWRSIKLRKGKPPRGQGRRVIVYRIFTGGPEVLGIKPTKRVGLRGGRGVGYYPAAIEYGYARQDGVRVPPRSFLRAPLKTTGRRAIKRTGDSLWKQIRTYARSVA